MTSRLLRTALVIAAFVGFAVLTAHTASADFGCYGDVETFDDGVPPPGWGWTCSYSGSGQCWSQYNSSYSSLSSPPMARSYYSSGRYNVESELISPVFTTSLVAVSCSCST